MKNHFFDLTYSIVYAILVFSSLLYINFCLNKNRDPDKNPSDINSNIKLQLYYNSYY
jgi:hypothetical protein